MENTLSSTIAVSSLLMMIFSQEQGGSCLPDAPTDVAYHLSESVTKAQVHPQWSGAIKIADAFRP